MTRHIEHNHLQDFLEGLLEPETAAEVGEHLKVCSRCREELDALSDLVDGLGQLPVEAQLPRDLWPQIAWRMEGVVAPHAQSGLPGKETEVVPARSRRNRRIELPAWQLLAASIALMVISGSAVWAFLSGRADQGGALGPVFGSTAQMVGWEETYGVYEEAVTDLEAVLERGREVLDPETVRVLEENLQTIDLAIEEAQDALAQDPASAMLRRFLANNLKRKVDLLRQAAGAVYAIT